MASPARRQYLDLKARFPDSILLFRLGDFYELFDEDAEIGARVLKIQLTSREFARGDGRVPMAGIPHHARDAYVRRLIEAGHTVAICEQLTEPGKGLVERDVVRVITAGTLVEPAMIEATANNYLAAVNPGKGGYGLAYVDVTTGEFAVTQLVGANTEGELEGEMQRIGPVECLLPERDQDRVREIMPLGAHVTPYASHHFDHGAAARLLRRQFGVETLEAFGCEHMPLAVGAAGAIVAYLAYTNVAALELLVGLRTYAITHFMALDRYTRTSLELTASVRDGARQGSLLGVLDRTRTPMGARLLRTMVGQPLLDVAEIERRLDAVEELYGSTILRTQLARTLGDIGDVERLAGRVAQMLATPRDLLTLRDSLKGVEMIRDQFRPQCDELRSVYHALDTCTDVSDLISRAIPDGTGARIRPGFSRELDQLMEATRHARDYIAHLESLERQRTGIKSLKVGYNKVFGYYLEVGKANIDLVPERFIRKQTLVNGERYATAELKEYEAQVLSAEERIQELETEIIADLLREIEGRLDRILRTAAALARIDVYRGLAEIASDNRYVRPTLDVSRCLRITDGRHPVVELAHTDNAFIPNDCRLDEDDQVIVLTGPNMGGKSTTLRMVALVVLMAQIGSFVPASQAHIGVVDRVFSRVGAQDDIAAGQSTFMVEMVETAHILRHAGPLSLLILDEIGRGTSTYDGLAIARAVIEYIHARIGARTLFATHYHELIKLADELDHVTNYHVTVADEDGAVVFLHKLAAGGADRSYGIHVARLAGLPRSVTNRATRILRDLEHAARDGHRDRGSERRQLDLFADREAMDDPAAMIVDELMALDLHNMTPLGALQCLHELQHRAGRPADPCRGAASEATPRADSQA